MKKHELYNLVPPDSSSSLSLRAERVVEEARRLALLTELRNIADADPSTWGDMRDQFQPWAQNRARAAIAAYEAAPASQEAAPSAQSGGCKDVTDEVCRHRTNDRNEWCLECLAAYVTGHKEGSPR